MHSDTIANWHIGNLIRKYKLSLVNNRTRGMGSKPEWVAFCDTQTIITDGISGEVLSPQPGKSDDLHEAVKMAADNIDAFTRRLHAEL